MKTEADKESVLIIKQTFFLLDENTHYSLR